MFNMFGTLMINCETLGIDLCDAIGFYHEILSEGTIDSNNSNKFDEYFQDIDSCKQFKSDYFEITDYERNDTLYHDGTKENNQYLVLLSIKSEEAKN